MVPPLSGLSRAYLKSGFTYILIYLKTLVWFRMIKRIGFKLGTGDQMHPLSPTNLIYDTYLGYLVIFFFVQPLCFPEVIRHRGSGVFRGWSRHCNVTKFIERHDVDHRDFVDLFKVVFYVNFGHLWGHLENGSVRR